MSDSVDPDDLAAAMLMSMEKTDAEESTKNFQIQYGTGSYPGTSEAEESAKKTDAEESAKKTDAEESAKKTDAEESAKKTDAEESAKKTDTEESVKKPEAPTGEDCLKNPKVKNPNYHKWTILETHKLIQGMRIYGDCKKDRFLKVKKHYLPQLTSLQLSDKWRQLDITSKLPKYNVAESFSLRPKEKEMQKILEEYKSLTCAKAAAKGAKGKGLAAAAKVAKGKSKAAAAKGAKGLAAAAKVAKGKSKAAAADSSDSACAKAAAKGKGIALAADSSDSDSSIDANLAIGSLSSKHARWQRARKEREGLTEPGFMKDARKDGVGLMVHTKVADCNWFPNVLNCDATCYIDSVGSDGDSDEHNRVVLGGQESVLVQDPAQAKQSSQVPQTSTAETAAPHPQYVNYTITFSNNGFTVDDGPLRRADNPANADFMATVAKQLADLDQKLKNNSA